MLPESHRIWQRQRVGRYRTWCIGKDVTVRIAEIETFVVKMPNDVPYMGELEADVAPTRTGYFQRERYPTFYSLATEGFLVKITTDDGTIGWGEAQAPIVPETLKVLVERLFRPFYMGRDPLDIDVLWHLAYNGLHERGHITSFALDAIAACDIALWDIAGKATGQPLHKLMGGCFRSKVPCYVSGLPAPDLEGRVSLAREWVNRGFSAIKMAMGYGVDADLENLGAVREAVGEGVGLMNDAHWRYTLSEAIRLGRGMERIGCTFLEAPLVPEDLHGLSELARTLDMDVAMGEERRTRFQFREVLEIHAADIIQPDVGRMGLSEFRRIADLADAHSIPVIPHLGPAFGVYLAACIHAGASRPNLPIMEFQPSVLDKANGILIEPLVVEAGRYTVPTEPGLGVEVDEEALGRITVAG